MSVRALSPELAEFAINQINEDPRRLKDDLQCLKDWIQKQPHLRARTDDQWLVAFLRGCKFSLERAKEKIDLYYTCRTNAPEFYRLKYTDSLFHEILNLGTFTVLPKTASPVSPVVTIVRPGSYDAEKYNITDVMSVSYMIHKILLMEFEQSTIVGMTTILDLEGVTMSHFLQMTPGVMKKMVVTSQDATPFRMKGVHYINTPTGFETLFNYIKSLLSEKNQGRLYVHNKNYEAMYEHIPQDLLPVEYGGKCGTIKEISEFWKKKLHEYSSFLEDDEKYGTDEAKRPGKAKTAEDLFGVDGSFRKLEVD